MLYRNPIWRNSMSIKSSRLGMLDAGTVSTIIAAISAGSSAVVSICACLTELNSDHVAEGNYFPDSSLFLAVAFAPMILAFISGLVLIYRTELETKLSKILLASIVITGIYYVVTVALFLLDYAPVYHITAYIEHLFLPAANPY